MKRPPGRPHAVASESHWTGWLALALALGALAWGCERWSWWGVSDDAYITFRYSRNLVDGIGPVYNPGERVEGYTSPAWMLAMAAAIATGIDPVPASKALGVASAVALLLAVFLASRRAGVAGWAAGLACLPLATSPVLQDWTVSGMETVTYAVIFFVSLARLAAPNPSPGGAALTSACLVVATLVRPEGAAWWALGGAWIVLGAPAKERMRLGRAYAWPGVLLAAHLAWRLSYYGVLFPNTYYTKTGGGWKMWEWGLWELGRFAADPAHMLWLLLAAAGATVGWALRARAASAFAGATLLHVVYVLSVGGDSLWAHRFFVPVLGPLAWLTALLFLDGSRRRARWALAAAGLVVAAGLGVWRSESHYLPPLRDFLAYYEGNDKLGRHLAAHRDPPTWIAVAAAGAIPFYSGLPAIDMFGLNERHIARLPFPDPDVALLKWDYPYVLSRRPELIVVNRGYFRAGDPEADAVLREPARLVRHETDAELFRHVGEDGGYQLRPLDLGDGSVFWVFERVR
jgi:hypothetical protein